MSRRTQRGFTLVEILIVVIILGILAAIVIPQFTSASTEARRGAAQSMAQTVRSQIQLYKLQNGDVLPNIVGSNATGTHWDDLMTQSTYNGRNFGPYLQEVPRNGLFTTDTLQMQVTNGTANPAAATGWVYDYNGGAGSGNFWAVEPVSGGTAWELITK